MVATHLINSLLSMSYFFCSFHTLFSLIIFLTNGLLAFIHLTFGTMQTLSSINIHSVESVSKHKKTGGNLPSFYVDGLKNNDATSE